MTFATIYGIMKIEVCAANIIHVRYSPTAEFKEKTLNTYAIKTYWDYSEYKVIEENGTLKITTPKLSLLIDKSTGKVNYNDADGNLILAERNRSVSNITLDDDTASYEIGQEFFSDANEALYGFGNLNDTMGIKNQSVAISQNNTQKRTPMFYSNMGYGILFDITSNGQLTWSDDGSIYKYTSKATDSMDYYFFYGPDADDVISGYRTITGTATMLPKSAFGYIQSRNRYSSQSELISIVDTFRQKGIPLDNIVIDYRWWKGEFNDITNWDYSKWPDPLSMMDYLHSQNVTTSISVWPSFIKGTDAHNIMCNKGYLFPLNSGFGYTYDPTTTASRKTYWDLIKNNIWDKGLDSIWLDACEPETSNWVHDDKSEQTLWGNSKLIGTLYPLLTSQGMYEGQREIPDNKKRVNTLARGAIAGIQRYGAQSWSGDITSTWEQLAKEISGVINFSAAGLPYFSTDTGGYFGFNTKDDKDREMFLRWLQFSTFNSIMRVHGVSNCREPWQFGSRYEEYIVSYITLRERLMPYIYSLVGQVTHNDYTIVRALIFDYRCDNNIKNIKDQFMFGPQLMVCPITTAGARSRSVYLPLGIWINFWTGESIKSEGQSYTISAPLKQIPLFVKAGSVIPMGQPIKYATESVDQIELRVYMGESGSFSMYEDEGNNYNYENGKFSTIEFTYDECTKTLFISDRRGSFDGMLETRTFNIVFVQPFYGIGVDLSPIYQASVTYNGSSTSVAFDQNWELPLPTLDTDTLPIPSAPPTAKRAVKAMIGYWACDEGEGAKVSDSSGSFNHGSLGPNTSYWTADGKVNNAILFSGGSVMQPGTYIEVSNDSSLDLTTEGSFSAWLYVTATEHANIISKGGNRHNIPGYSFILHDGSTLHLVLQSDFNSNSKTEKTIAQATVNINKNTWHQVGFSWKSKDSGGDGIIRIYIDGEQVTDDSNSINYFEGPIGANNTPLFLGRSDSESNNPNYYKGKMDEIKLFNYALNASEMVALYNAENIIVPNISDVTLKPENSQIVLTWTDIIYADFNSVEVNVQSVNGNYNESFIVNKGVQTLTISDLNNNEYYYITIKTLTTSKKTSQGVYMVGTPNAYMTTIDCVVTNDTTVYGWIVNNSSIDVVGNLLIETFEGDKLIDSHTQNNVAVYGADMLQFSNQLLMFSCSQTVKISFIAYEGYPLAQNVIVNREPIYHNLLTEEKTN